MKRKLHLNEQCRIEEYNKKRSGIRKAGIKGAKQTKLGLKRKFKDPVQKKKTKKKESGL